MGWILWEMQPACAASCGRFIQHGNSCQSLQKDLERLHAAYPLQFKQQGACCLCAQMAFQELHSPSHALQELQSCNDLL